jgi:hypothetical protein
MPYEYIEAWGEGTMPLLHHAFSVAAEASLPGGSGKGTRSTSTAGLKRTPREIAEELAYRDATGALCLPSAAFQRLLREAGGGHKERGTRKTLKYKVPASVLVLGGDDRGGPVPLFDKSRAKRLKDFEVHSCSAVNAFTKGRILTHRPRMDVWAFKLLLRINTELMDSALVRQLLQEGGQQIGVGSYRPEKGGTFGLFDVVAWDARDGRSEIHKSAAE